MIFEAILVPTWLHFGRILGVLGASGRLLGGRSASWGHLGAALERLGGILGRLGASWGRLGASLGRLGASGARFSWDSILDTILYPICNRFSLDLATFETCVKALWYYKNSSFEALRQFPDQTEKPKEIIGFCVLRGSTFASRVALGGVLGVVLGVLGRLAGLLEVFLCVQGASWGVLGRL